MVNPDDSALESRERDTPDREAPSDTKLWKRNELRTIGRALVNSWDIPKDVIEQSYEAIRAILAADSPRRTKLRAITLLTQIRRDSAHIILQHQANLIKQEALARRESAPTAPTNVVQAVQLMMQDGATAQPITVDAADAVIQAETPPKAPGKKGEPAVIPHPQGSEGQGNAVETPGGSGVDRGPSPLIDTTLLQKSVGFSGDGNPGDGREFFSSEELESGDS